MTSARTAQLSRCRSQSRGASRGPINPRITPSVAKDATYASARASWSDENTLRASSGVAGGAEGVSRETSFTEESSARQYDDVATGLHALGLGLAAGIGYRVVHDLPLERRHRVERNRLTGLLDPGRDLPGKLD